MPREVVQKHQKQLADAGMVPIGSADIPPGTYLFLGQKMIIIVHIKGKGYRIHIHGKDYIFPLAERAPPEGYLTTNYTAYVFPSHGGLLFHSQLKFLYSWLHRDKSYTDWSLGFTARRIEHPEPQQTRYNTRFSAKQIPPFGNDYVEYETRIIVRGKENSMTAFQPKFLHGSTVSYRVDQIGVCETATNRIKVAHDKAVASGGIDRALVLGVRGTGDSDDEADSSAEEE